jgi:membrane-bound lytic murein transglycosylase B
MRIALLLPFALAASLQDVPFGAWLDNFRSEARQRGYSDELLDKTVGNLEPLERAIETDRAQPELTIGFERYFESRVNTQVIRRGREALREHRRLLTRVEKEYGVPRRVVVAVWGMESRYGRNQGRTPVFQALATLAWEPRRSGFFRGQLFDAIEMVSRGDIEASAMKGSWAGAMGQTQFMPSSYLAYAVDADRDGRRDIWRSNADALASIANYLKGQGWTRESTWGREVKLSRAGVDWAEALPLRTDGCSAMRDMTEAQPLREWRRRGARLAGGATLPRTNRPARLVRVQNRSFLVYPNYDALLRYNCAQHYALAIAMLSERLR